MSSSRRLSAASASGTVQAVTDVGSVPHPEHLYDYQERAILSGSLDDHDPDLISRYNADGYVALSGFGDVVVKDLKHSIENLCDGSNQAFKAAVKSQVEAGEPDFTSGSKIPWVQYEANTEEAKDNLLTPSILPRVRKIMGFVGYEKCIDQVVNDPRLVSIVKQLLGSDDEIELFQDMALLKPKQGREKPWHQDNAYFDIAKGTKVVGCWLAIDEATPDNGCLRMKRGGHLSGPIYHFSVRDYQICDENAPKENIVAVALKPGQLVLFDGLIPHGTPTNTSASSRYALQFHWVKKGTAIVPKDGPGGRTEVFGGSANNLSC